MGWAGLRGESGVLKCAPVRVLKAEIPEILDNDDDLGEILDDTYICTILSCPLSYIVLSNALRCPFFCPTLSCTVLSSVLH